jgi:hypothetical protein
MKFIKFTVLSLFLSASCLTTFAQDLPPATEDKDLGEVVTDGPGEDPPHPGGGTAVPLDSLVMLIALAGGGISMAFFSKSKKKKE